MKVGEQYYISYPKAVHYKLINENGVKKTPINQLLWGDWARIDEIDGENVRIQCRGRNGWVGRKNLQKDRILEVNFVDVGQGDGCHIQTMEDKAIIIDAGESDNMSQFLKWRFGKFSKRFNFESFIISHSDKDHYYGFPKILKYKNVHVGAIYHNTLIEYKVNDEASLGREEMVNGDKYIMDIIQTEDQLKEILDDPAKKKGNYLKMLNKAVNSGRVKVIEGLVSGINPDENIYVPGYAPEDERGMTMRILGPVLRDINGQYALKRFPGKIGKTKNGHSVIILLEIGKVKILLGGDLNQKSQEYLLEHYTGNTEDSASDQISKGRSFFQVDIAKACHHGASDISPIFLQVTNPLATIISSGDNESHSHPRPDALGMIGKFSRSDRPLIFSTELARSGNMGIKHPYRVQKKIKNEIKKYRKILSNPDAKKNEKKSAQEKIYESLKNIQRSVVNYGMIIVRTDGKNAIIAQRLESTKKNRRWDVYTFKVDEESNMLQYVPGSKED